MIFFSAGLELMLRDAFPNFFSMEVLNHESQKTFSAFVRFQAVSLLIPLTTVHETKLGFGISRPEWKFKWNERN